jgi:hypothetical protein
MWDEMRKERGWLWGTFFSRRRRTELIAGANGCLPGKQMRGQLAVFTGNRCDIWKKIGCKNECESGREGEGELHSKGGAGFSFFLYTFLLIVVR